MRPAEYRRIAKRLWSSNTEAARALGVTRMAEWRYRQDGVSGPVERLVQVLVQLRKLERDLEKQSAQLAAIRKGEDRAAARIHVHAPEDRRGGLPAAVVPIRKRKPKARVTAELQRVITKE